MTRPASVASGGLASGGLRIEFVNLVEVHCWRTWRFIAGGLGGFED